MPDTFVKVKFGDDQVLLCNANCRSDILLKNIKQRCGYNFAEDVELCDENGRVKQLLKHQQEYAVTNCAEREMLVLLRVDKIENDVTYVPLVTSLQNNKDFLEKLNVVKGKKGKANQHSSSSGESVSPTRAGGGKTTPKGNAGKSKTGGTSARRSSNSTK